MSFQNNPYKHFEFRQRDSGYAWECAGCGNESLNTWPGTAAIHALVMDFYGHLRADHHLTPEEAKEVRW